MDVATPGPPMDAAPDSTGADEAPQDFALPDLVGPLEYLGTDAVRKVYALSQRRLFPIGATVIEQGAKLDVVHLLLYGRVTVVLTRPDGQQLLLGVRGPGTSLGELALLGGHRASAEVVALDQVTTLEVPGEDFLDLLGESPAAMLALLKQVSRRLRVAERRLADVGSVSPTVRLARQLLEHALSPHAEVDVKGEISLPLDVDNLANWIKSTPAQADDALRVLERSRLVRHWGSGLTIADLEGLRVVALM